MTTIDKLQPGDRFRFRGDWQTNPSTWEVIGPPDELTKLIPCVAISGERGRSNFYGNVTVTAI